MEIVKMLCEDQDFRQTWKWKLKFIKPNPNQPIPGVLVQNKFKILPDIPHAYTANAISGPRIELQIKVIEILRRL